MFISLCIFPDKKNNHLVMMWFANEPETVHQKLLVWEIPVTGGQNQCYVQNKRNEDSASHCSPLTYGLAQAWTSRKGNSLGPAGTAQAASHQLMVQLIQAYPAAVWLPPNQIINSSRAI